jgi:hypothetical protein
MKISKMLVAAFLSLMTSASYAVTVGSRSNVTVALTSTYSVDGLVVDGEPTSVKETVKGAVTTVESSMKLKIEKFTNKELLTAMAEDAQLDGTIVGWSIVMIDFDCYAIKKGMSAVTVPVNFSTDEDLFVSAYTAKYSYNDDTTKETFTESGSGKTVGYVSSDFFAVEAQGTASYSYKAVKGKLGTGEFAQEYGGDNGNDAYYLEGASKLSGLSGKFTDGEGGSLIEGSISFSAQTVVDLDLIGVSAGF